jgi:Uncharacterized protein conserved in bacteria
MAAHVLPPVLPPIGVGFRSPHFAAIVATRPAVGWFEAHPENYLGGGEPLAQLRTLRRDWPISLHGVGLSLGSADGIDDRHLDRFACLCERIEPTLVSEHLAWSISGGVYLNDLLPLPYTDESFGVVAANIERVQERLGRRVLIENPSSYLRFSCSSLGEAEFLAALVRCTGCGLLCDVNNIVVSCHNIGGDPIAYLDALPAGAVEEIHLAGHAVVDADGTTMLIDDHGSVVCPPVWALFEDAVHRFPQAAPLIEWDSNLPAFDILLAEAIEAARRQRLVLAEVRHDRAA